VRWNQCGFCGIVRANRHSAEPPLRARGDLGRRGAVIVPDGVLFGSSNAHVDIRKTLIEEDQQTDPLIRGALDAALNAMSALAGLKLIGFGIWERRSNGGRNVTFPARQYSINGERRSFALLRPIVDIAGQERLRAAILEAFAAYEQEGQS